MRDSEPLSRPGTLPAYELVSSCDDAVDPSEITVFDPGSSSLTTTWITADVADAVGLETMR